MYPQVNLIGYCSMELGISSKDLQNSDFDKAWYNEE
jgi:hypothetical protein